MRPAFRFLLVLCPLLLVAYPGAAQTGTPFDLQTAIAQAAAGETVRVPPGRYLGPIVLDKSIHLLGESDGQGQRPILDGAGRGTVLTVTASGAVVENFTIRGSGQLVDQEDGGVAVERAQGVQLIGNQLEDVLYGIRGVQAQGLQLRQNSIVGKDLPMGRRGDGIRLWQSEECLVEDNRLDRVRDAVFWFSDRTVVRGNRFQDSRYGVHMMYTDDMTVTDNQLVGNSVGAYLMYSAAVSVSGNTFHGNRGPSGYGLALKDMDGVDVHDNYFFDNRVGLFFDNSPSRVDLTQQIRRNVLAYNDVGVLMMPAVQRNLLSGNTFLENLEQVGLKGGGSDPGDELGQNGWDGNFWSDYVGYDLDAEGWADGVGDLPYRAESLFENLASRYPELKLFHFSPVEQAVDMAARAFPIIRPRPKLTDAAPLMAPPQPQAPPTLDRPGGQMGGFALALLLGSGALIWAIQRTAGRSSVATPRAPALAQPRKEPSTMLTVTQLTKRYPQPGRPWWSDATVVALDKVSLQLAAGQSLALWGANGAGKTTVLKCILGLLHCEGELTLAGLDLRRDGRRARSLMGYVPQELAFHNDMRVAETCRFYANLKGLSTEPVARVLAQVGLAEQAQKAVGALSGGMKQRLALALALLADPPMLLLDEPTSNLDQAARDEFLELLLTLRQAGKTLLFTSHHLAEVERLADQIALLQDGRLVTVGAAAQISAGLRLGGPVAPASGAAVPSPDPIGGPRPQAELAAAAAD